MAEIQKADDGARRKAMLALTIVGLFGALTIVAFEQNISALDQWLRAEPSQTASRAQLMLWVLCALVELPLVALGFHLWFFAKRIFEGERFPPLGAAVVRDTPVLHGAAARRRGRIIQALAVSVALSAILGPVIFARLVALFSHVS
jgi:hypothetical protein